MASPFKDLTAGSSTAQSVDAYRAGNPALWGNMYAAIQTGQLQVGKPYQWQAGDEWSGPVGPVVTYVPILNADGTDTGWKAEQVAPNVYDLQSTHGDYLQHMVFRADQESGYIEPIQNTQQQVNFGRWNYAGSGLSQILQNPVTAIMASALLPGAGTALGSALGLGEGALATTAGNALIGGTTAEAQGGDFLKGALASGLTTAIPEVVSQVADVTPAQAAAGLNLTKAVVNEDPIAALVSAANLSNAPSYSELTPADQVGYEPANLPTEQDVLSAIVKDTTVPTLDEILPAIQDFQQQIAANEIPNVEAIVNQVAADNPTLTRDEVQQMVEGSIANLPAGLSPDDVKSIVTESLNNLPAQLTEQDVINVIGQQNFATADQLTQQGKDFASYLQQQGLDYETALSEALKAQQTEFGTQLEGALKGYATEDLLNQQGKDLMDYLQQQGLDYETSLSEALKAQETQFGTDLSETEQSILDEMARTGELTQSQIDQLKNSLEGYQGATSQSIDNVIKLIGGITAGIGATNAALQTLQDQGKPTEFGIVGVPTEWKSPVYETQPVQFQPPTPIDFGTKDLLSGTQWENPLIIPQPGPVNLQGYQANPLMTQFNYQSSVSPTDVIGNIGGKPLSIADIISGIQSGQTFSS